MREDISHTYKNEKTGIKLVFEEFEEVNYGRSDWLFKFYKNDKLESNYFNYDTDRLLGNLNDFSFSSSNGRYYYIPTLTPVIYDAVKDEFNTIEIPFKSHNLKLIKNVFHHDKLLIIYKTGFVIINLTNNIFSFETFSDDVAYIVGANQKETGEIEIEYGDIKDKCFKKRVIKL